MFLESVKNLGVKEMVLAGFKKYLDEKKKETLIKISVIFKL